VTEDTTGSRTFSGTMEEVVGTTKTVRDITINKDTQNAYQLNIKIKSSGPKDLASDFTISLTKQNLSSLSIALPAVQGTFTGYYEAGSLFGTVAAPGGSFDVAVVEEGVAVDGVLYSY